MVGIRRTTPTTRAAVQRDQARRLMRMVAPEGVDGGRIAGFDTGLFRRGARGLAGQWVAFSTLVVWRGANGLFQDDGRFWSGVWRRDVDERAHK
jgi:hypothetical protein